MSHCGGKRSSTQNENVWHRYRHVRPHVFSLQQLLRYFSKIPERPRNHIKRAKGIQRKMSKTTLCQTDRTVEKLITLCVFPPTSLPFLLIPEHKAQRP